MSPNTGGVSLREKLPGANRGRASNDTLSSWKLVLFAVIDTPCQLFLKGDGFYPGNGISR